MAGQPVVQLVVVVLDIREDNPKAREVSPAHLGEDSGGFSMELYLKHREWNALLGALAIVAVLVAKMMFLRH